jgi:hypothetical protein
MPATKAMPNFMEDYKNAAAYPVRTVFDESRALKLRAVRAHAIAGDLHAHPSRRQVRSRQQQHA